MSHGLYLALVAVHILAAAVWVGSMAFFALVLVPVIRRPELRAQSGQLVSITGRRYRVVGWATLATLVATGVVLLVQRGIGWETFGSAAFWGSGFGHVLAMKLGLVLLVLVMSGAHDFAMGPRATALLRSDPGSPAAQRLRRTASWMGRVTLLLSIAIVALAVALVRGAP